MAGSKTHKEIDEVRARVMLAIIALLALALLVACGMTCCLHCRRGASRADDVEAQQQQESQHREPPRVVVDDAGGGNQHREPPRVPPNTPRQLERDVEADQLLRHHLADEVELRRPTPYSSSSASTSSSIVLHIVTVCHVRREDEDRAATTQGVAQA